MSPRTEPVTSERLYRPIEPFVYAPALDGLRAVCLMAVLFYHARFDWAVGAFLGMPVFFVLSGFLIMWQLLPQLNAQGAMSYSEFIGRRSRRLLPGIWVTLGLIVAIAYLGGWHQEQLDALRNDVVASVVGLTNWYFIAADRSYGDWFVAPSPLEHFWSLAIEIQFYVVFSLVCMGLIRLVQPKSTAFKLRTLALAIASGAVISMALSWWLSRNVGIDRAYFGTDTRFNELGVGALLATLMAYRPQLWGFRGSRWAQLVAGLGVIAMVWAFHVANLRSEAVYPFGFTGAAVVTAFVIIACVGQGPVQQLFSLAPLRRIGVLSFGIYLYHWPIFLLVSYESTGLTPALLFGVRMAITYVLAELSYKFIENPLRRGALLHSYRFVGIGILVIAVLTVGTLRMPEQPIDPVARPEPLIPPVVSTTLPEPALDVMIVGDEFAASLATSLNGHTRINYETAVVPTCGYGVGGWVTMSTGVERDEDRCWDAIRSWGDQIANADVDAVIALANVRDLTDRRLTFQDEWMDIHTVRIQEFIHTEMTAGFRALLANQRAVAVATLPAMNTQHFVEPIEPQLSADNPDDNALQILQFHAIADAAPATGVAENDAQRVMALNSIVTSVAAGLDIGVVPLFEWVTEFPEGSLDTQWRPDGYGFNEEAGQYLAAEFDSYIRDDLLVSPVSVTPPSDPELSEIPPVPEFPPLHVAQPGREIRVGVLGDSVAAGIGEGIVRAENLPADVRVSFGAKYGCPIARGGFFRFMRDVNEFEASCDWSSRFSELVLSEQPHVVLISSAVWEVVDRRLPGDTEFRHLGTPLVDNYFLVELIRAVDLVASQGAHVVLLTQPAHEVGLRAGYSGLPESNPTRIDRLNELILQAQTYRPERVSVIDFAAHVHAVEGQQVDPQSRPDGLHFSAQRLDEFAHWIVPQLVGVAVENE